jgi:peroxiredoxin
MRADENDAFFKSGIRHAGQGYQELSFQKAFAAVFAPRNLSTHEPKLKRVPALPQAILAVEDEPKFQLERTMTIKVGDKIPSATLMQMKDGGPKPVSTDDLFAGKKVVLFALPGAFTPTCSAKHLPGFIQHAEEIKGKGIDAIACLSVNDAFVMGAWGDQQKAGDKVMMLADGNGDLTKALGLTMDGSRFGMGQRSQRYSMVVDNGVVKELNVEEPGAFSVSSAEHVMKQL